MIIKNRIEKWIVLILLTVWPGDLWGQWLNGYTHRNKIEIITNGVSGPQELVDFPLLVSMSGPELRTVTYGGELLDLLGRDIRFTMEDGTLLDFDMEFYSMTTGNLVAWVRIPGLSNSENFNIYVYYGNPSVDTYPPSSNVWSSEFRGVWHMSSNTEDATRYENHGIDKGTSSMDGKIGLSRGFDGIEDKVGVPYDNSLGIQDNLSIETWLRYTDNDDLYNGLITKQGDYELWYAKDHIMFIVDGGSIEYPIELGEANWYHICATYDRSNQRLFVNGTEVSSLPNTTQMSNETTDALGIGFSDGESSSALTGDLDEVRISSRTLSPDWIRTSYRNQDNSAAFSVYIETEISNDIPCEATLISLNDDCDTNIYSTLGATYSGIPLTPCSTLSRADTWFKVVVPASGSINMKLESGPTPEIPSQTDWLMRPGLALYHGTCDNLTYDTCWVHASAGPPFQIPEMMLSSYTPGDTIFIKIWSSDLSVGKFRICALGNDELPTITCPDNIESPNDYNQCSASLTNPIPEASSVNGIATLLNDYNGTSDASDTYPVGITMVQWTATDSFANQATCSHSITVSDTVGPVFNCPENVSEYLIDNCDFVIPNYGSTLGLLDNCDPSPIFTQSPQAGSLLSGSGTIQEVVLTAEDLSGNQSVCSFQLTLVDQSPPTVSRLSDTVVFAEDGQNESFVILPVPGFEDNCGIMSIINSHNGDQDASGTYPYGITIVEYTVSDINGNVAIFNQEVEVRLENEPGHGLIIPEAFSPNEDGQNDRFEILGLDQYPENELTVYNVHGIEIFTMSNYDNSWDGMARAGLGDNSKLPTGTYYYILNLNSEESFVKGFIYLKQE